MQRQMEAVQASLSSLPASEQAPYLLSLLSSAYQQRQLDERLAEHWRRQCGKVRQRLSGLRVEMDRLHDELANTDGDEADSEQPDTNGKEEKQYGHLLPPPLQPAPSRTNGQLLHAADGETEAAFEGFSDYSTLLAATEAKLEVERRQGQSQQRQHLSLSASATAHVPATVSSSSHYHHDRTLTTAGKQLVRSILSLASPTRSLDLPALQRLCERVGRSAAASAGDDDGDVWWVWQSYASEGEDGEQGMGQAEMEQLYEQEWDVDEDGRRLGLV